MSAIDPLQTFRSERKVPRWGSDMKSETTQPHTVLLVHGIRTRADWQDMVQEALEEIPGVSVKRVKYGKFDLVRFLLPGPTRRPPIEKTRSRLFLAIIEANKQSAKLSIICHSYGTYAITRILEETRIIELEHLVMCGSIVHENFNWDQVRAQIRGHLINDFGTKDIWPVIAKSVTWGYGSTGTFGCGYPVEDRRHTKAHSEFFDVEFVRQYWVPLFSDGSVTKKRFEKGVVPGSPAIFKIFELPLRWIILLFLVGLAALGSFQLYGTFQAYVQDEGFRKTSGVYYGDIYLTAQADNSPFIRFLDTNNGEIVGIFSIVDASIQGQTHNYLRECGIIEAQRDDQSGEEYSKYTKGAYEQDNVLSGNLYNKELPLPQLVGDAEKKLSAMADGDDVEITDRQNYYLCRAASLFIRTMQLDPAMSAGGTGVVNYDLNGFFRVRKRALSGSITYDLNEVEVPMLQIQRHLNIKSEMKENEFGE